MKGNQIPKSYAKAAASIPSILAYRKEFRSGYSIPLFPVVLYALLFLAWLIALRQQVPGYAVHLVGVSICVVSFLAVRRNRNRVLALLGLARQEKRARTVPKIKEPMMRLSRYIAYTWMAVFLGILWWLPVSQTDAKSGFLVFDLTGKILLIFAFETFCLDKIWFVRKTRIPGALGLASFILCIVMLIQFIQGNINLWVF